MQVVALGRKLTQKDELKKLNWRSDITENDFVMQTPTMMQRETCRGGGRRRRRELKNLKKPPRRRRRKKVSEEIEYLHAPTASRLPLLCSVVLPYSAYISRVFNFTNFELFAKFIQLKF